MQYGILVSSVRSVKQVDSSRRIPLSTDHVDMHLLTHSYPLCTLYIHTNIHITITHSTDPMLRQTSRRAELSFCLQSGGGTQTNLFVYQIYAGLKLILPNALPTLSPAHHLQRPALPEPQPGDRFCSSCKVETGGQSRHYLRDFKFLAPLVALRNLT